MEFGRKLRPAPEEKEKEKREFGRKLRPAPELKEEEEE